MDRSRPKSRARLIKRMALFGTLTLVLVGGGVTLAGIDFSSRRIDRDTLSIDTVQHGTMEIKVSANGQLLPKNIEQIGAQVTGRVARTHVKPGDIVKAGQLLVELANPEIIASADEAYSAWEGAVTDLEASEAELQTNLLNQEIAVVQAQFDLERAELQLEAETKLIGQQIISEIDYKRTQLDVSQLTRTLAIEESRLQKIRDNIKVQLAAGQSRVTELARALDRARNQAANLRIVAGIDGIVQAVNVDVGQQLQPGSPIGHIAQQDQLYAELKVPAREATEVQAGQHVVVDTRSGTVAGIVTRIDPGVTEGTVIVDVDLQGELPAGARPQLQIEGIVYISRLPDALYVGKPAYVKTDASVSVYKLDAEGRYATRATIRAGKVSLNYLQALQGLEAGDRIITSEIGEWQGEERILLN
ncbi:MAG: efflux RND transporter periplasmic adaptor subunit [Gammaproteobacteria bacterium]|nr:efflux RND transporter periplasmic adaptor subunit [Gammaproteobacteria bacterium]